MKKIIGILLLSVCVMVGAAACGASEIVLEDAAVAVSIQDDATTAWTSDSAAEAAAGVTVSEHGESADDASSVKAQICVYVCGAVVTPGVYALPEGARIYEALELAGGLAADADATAVNQAQTITDGMMIRIPVIGESLPREAVQTTAESRTGTASAADGSGLVNINTADAAQLMTLPGIGESKAAAILAYRELHGSYASKEELLNVSGIGDATYRNLESRIAVQ